jgi:hypothetical protein
MHYVTIQYTSMYIHEQLALQIRKDVESSISSDTLPALLANCVSLFPSLMNEEIILIWTQLKEKQPITHNTINELINHITAAAEDSVKMTLH